MREKLKGTVVRGHAIKLGDHIDTDLIYPGRYLSIMKPEETALHALEGLNSDFPERIRSGDIIVAGRDFGCGSSRSQAVTSLKYAGIGAVVAISFARVFFRNSINQGLPVIECPTVYEFVSEGDSIQIDLKEGIIYTAEKPIYFQPLPDFLLKIIFSGGLVSYTRELFKSSQPPKSG